MVFNLLKKFSLFSVIFFVALTPGMAQHAEESLLENIEIMETVLDKIITPGRGNFNFWSSNSKGYYLKDYGIIFNVGYSSLDTRVLTLTKEGKTEAVTKGVYILNDGSATPKSHEEEIKTLKERIVRFYSEWAFAFKELPPQEKITLIVDFNGHFSTWYRADVDGSDEQFRQLIASVSMKDILDRTQEKLTAESFINQINFDEINSVDEDISIMSNVIQTSLEHRNKNVALLTSGDVRGIYFQGYGAIFITDLSPATQSVQMYLRSLYKDGAPSVTFEDKIPNPDLAEENLYKVEDKLIHIISNYGHTLRNLKQDEWLEVALNLHNTFMNKNYTKSVMRIQKKTLDEFTQSKINYEQLKKKVKIVRY
ncbi:MAG: hypothetical protein ACOY90_23055 [Candidatus Zhuqueibacterota bacterium]